MLRRALGLLVGLALLSSCVSAPRASEPSPESAPPMPAAPARAERVRVARVVDGDTIVLSGLDIGTIDPRTGGRIARLIGVDTPEVYGDTACYGREASAFTRDALESEEVLVDFDVGRLDRYGRALVYVWLTDSTFFNARLVAEGFASPYTVPPDVRYADLLVRLASQARESARGLWRHC